MRILNTLVLGIMVVASLSFAAIGWSGSNVTIYGKSPAPTYITLLDDSRFVACWMDTQYDLLRYNGVIPPNNTPGNNNNDPFIKKFCAFGDVVTDKGLIQYNTLRQAIQHNRGIQVSLEDADKESTLGFRIREVSEY